MICGDHKIWRNHYLGNGFLEKCGRTVFEKVSPTDNFETTKTGIFVVARLLQ